MQTLPPLTAFQAIVVIGSFVVGLLHMLAANGKVFGLASVPTRVLPYLATLGTGLSGFVAYVSSVGGTAFSQHLGTAVFYAVFLGAGPALIGGVGPATAAHVLLGWKVNVKRPAANDGSMSVSKAA